MGGDKRERNVKIVVQKWYRSLTFEVVVLHGNHFPTSGLTRLQHQSLINWLQNEKSRERGVR